MSSAPDNKNIVDEMLSLGLVDEAQAKEWYAEIAARSGEGDIHVTLPSAEPEEEIGADLDMDEADMPVDFPKADDKKPVVEEKLPEPVKDVVAVVPKKVKAAPSTKAAKKPEAKSVSAAADYLASKIDLGNGVQRTASEMIASFSAVKVKEKAKEFARYVVNGGSLSVYTTIGIKMLKETGECSGAKLARRMMDGVDGKKYSVGTARAQAQQVHNLLFKFNIIDKEGKPVKESPLAKKLIGA